MVDLRATNMKLRQRARNVIRAVVGSLCTSSDAELDAVLEICHGSVKLACATLSLEISPAVAQERLKRHGGALSRVLEEGRVQSKLQGISAEQLVLCVDAGGSSCKAVVMSADGQVGNGSAGPCNV
jgi:N-acetylmuramic acid 6-phosphate etherase